jgi:hypothetical protein
MTTAAPIPATPADDAPDWRRALLDEQLDMLRRLAQAGIAIAEAAQRRATEWTDGALPSGEDIGGAALAYGRAMRGAGMAIALQNRLVRDFGLKAAANDDEDDYSDIKPGELEVVWLPPEPAPQSSKGMGRKQKAEVLDLVRLVAETAAPGCGDGGGGESGADIDRLLDDAAGRLGSFAFDGLPMGAVLADICRHLGLKPDWTALAAQAWAQAEIETGDDRSPFLNPDNVSPPPQRREGEPAGWRGHAGPPPWPPRRPVPIDWSS